MNITDTVELFYDESCPFRESDAAWCIIFDETKRSSLGGKAATFLPKSQCEINEKDKIISIPVWLAEKKGLI